MEPTFQGIYRNIDNFIAMIYLETTGLDMGLPVLFASRGLVPPRFRVGYVDQSFCDISILQELPLKTPFANLLRAQKAFSAMSLKMGRPARSERP